MEPGQVCNQLVHQFDATAQGHLAIIGTILINVIMLVKVWLTARSTNIETKDMNRKFNAS